MMRVFALLLPLFAAASIRVPQIRLCEPGSSDCGLQRPIRSRQFSECTVDCDDWSQFTNPVAVTSFSVDNIRRSELTWRSETPEMVDGSPIYVQNVPTSVGRRNLLIVSTISGRLIAFNAGTGAVMWSTTPPSGPRWTTSSPALDPNRLFVYAYTLDGYVHRYSVATGDEVRGDGWPELITLKGDVEKGSSALSIATSANGDTYLYMTIAAYPEPGDDGDYQGHLVAINVTTGTQNVFNAQCSDKTFHLRVNDCDVRQAGIWARSGAVYDSRTDRVYVTTGNGVFDADRGGFNWASSVVALRPDGSTDGGTPVDSYTPTNYQQLNELDLDLSSTTVAPLLLPEDSALPPLAVQGGKDGKLRLLDLSNLSGGGAPRRTGGELQVISMPFRGAILTRPATWLVGTTTYIAVTTREGTAVFAADTSSDRPRLTNVWQSSGGCASPIYANGLLICARSGALVARDAVTGQVLWMDNTIGAIHWQSPIVVGDTLFIADSAGVNAYTVQ